MWSQATAAPSRGVEKYQNDWCVADHPEVVIANIQIKHKMRPHSGQRFRGLEL